MILHNQCWRYPMEMNSYTVFIDNILPLYRQNYLRYYKIPINLFQIQRKMLGGKFYIIILYRQSNEPFAIAELFL